MGKSEKKAIKDKNMNQPSHKRKLKYNGCGKTHLRAACPYLESICNTCKMKGHLATVCRSATKKKSTENTQHNKYLVIKAFSSLQRNQRIYVQATVNNKLVQFQHNIGSDITIIGKRQWINLGKPELRRSAVIQHAGGKNFNTIGYFSENMTIQGHEGRTEIHVAARNKINLLGLNAIDALNL